MAGTIPLFLGALLSDIAYKPYAIGLRNPTALTIQPETGPLWSVVNERNELGPNRVPGYLTAAWVLTSPTASSSARTARTQSATKWFSSPSATAGVTVGPNGALIVADDLSNTIWRVTRNR